MHQYLRTPLYLGTYLVIGLLMSCTKGDSVFPDSSLGEKCNPNPCENGGTCAAGGDTFTCECAAGYSGNTCATNIDECSPNPCQNDGTCADGVDGFTCTCAAGYAGETCQPVTLQVVSVTAGRCALFDDGSVKCWGNNSDGQLGRGDTMSRGDEPGEMGDALLPVALGTGRSVKSLTAGYAHTCALLDDNSVRCWGYNATGQLGQGDTISRGDEPGEMGDALLPVTLGTGRSAKNVTAGGSYVCALLDDNSVKCWGYNATGQLGQGDTISRGDEPGEMGDALLPVALGTGRSANSLAAGSLHACALLDDNSVKCWGDNRGGQLGQGDLSKRGDGAGEMGDALMPIALGTGRLAKSVTTGGAHTCALLNDNAVKCWGFNLEGQLGQGDTSSRGVATGQMGDAMSAVALGTGRSAKGVTSAGANTCAYLDDNSVKCWGYNNDGQLGQGDMTGRGVRSGQMGDALLPIKLRGL
jgi:E3 ubiquitin-protein ligase HERC3